MLFASVFVVVTLLVAICCPFLILRLMLFLLKPLAFVGLGIVVGSMGMPDLSQVDFDELERNLVDDAKEAALSLEQRATDSFATAMSGMEFPKIGSQLKAKRERNRF